MIIFGGNIMADKKRVRDQSTRTEYFAKYHAERRDQITIYTPKGTKDIWKSEASNRGLSLNAFIVKCVEDELRESD